jgi:hypothetical protein
MYSHPNWLASGERNERLHIEVRIKKAVSRVCGIAIDQIEAHHRFVEDRGLDWSAIIESLVDVGRA